MKAKKTAKKVAFVDRNAEFFLDIQEKMIAKIQYAKDNNIHLGDALGYGSGRPGKKGKDVKTVERESVVVRPTNFQSNVEYSGSNYNKFSLAVALNGYKTGWFGTYKQWETAGCKVTKGSKAFKGRVWITPEFTKKEFEENKAAMDKGEKPPHTLPDDHPAFFSVFNLDQVEGVTPEGIALIKELQDKLVVQVLKHVRYIPAVASVPPSDYFGNPWYKIEALDNIKFGTVKIYTDSTKYSCGCYNHKLHRIYMPPMETGFKSSGHYYKTLIHELAHSTMKDMSRPISTDHSSATYAREELIAEMTAWVMSVDLGIFAEDDKYPTSPAYLDHWLSNMKKSPDYLREVMSDVNKICHAIRQAIK